MSGLLNAFVILFIVVDPIGLVPMFLSLTPGATPSYRRSMAIRGTALATGMLLIFFFTGDALLKALGIELAAFRIAGGALLFLLAVDMVFARHSGMRSTTFREQAEAAGKDDISVFPLAFPLIAGPGAFTTLLFMSSTAHDPFLMGGMLLTLLSVLGLALLALLYADAISGLLGETGANVITRLFGLILAALAVQYMLEGLRDGFAR